MQAGLLAVVALLSGAADVREVARPAKVVTEERRLDVPAQASIAGVKRIIDLESAKWGASAPALHNRVDCESDFIWYKTNGQYAGVGQFAVETFSRGMGSIGTRRVIEKTERWRKKRTRIIFRHPDGTRTVTYGRWNRQKVVTTWKGWIPKSPPRTHTYAQIRIMARSMVGLGRVNDSEWECR